MPSARGLEKQPDECLLKHNENTTLKGGEENKKKDGDKVTVRTCQVLRTLCTLVVFAKLKHAIHEEHRSGPHTAVADVGVLPTTMPPLCWTAWIL